MDFVLDHGAEPFPGRDRKARRRLALACEVGVAQLADDRLGLDVQPIEERQSRVESVGEVSSATLIAARSAGHRLRVHVALDGREVPHEIAERERPGSKRPLESVGRNAGNDATCSRANTVPIFEKLAHGSNVHLSVLSLHDNDSMKPSRCCLLIVLLLLPLAPTTTAQTTSPSKTNPTAATGASMLPFWTGTPDAAAFDRAMDARLAHARQLLA